MPVSATALGRGRTIVFAAALAVSGAGLATTTAAPGAFAAPTVIASAIPAGAVHVESAHLVPEHDYAFVSGRLVNRSAHVLQSAWVEFDLRNAQGALIGTASGAVVDVMRLDPGESAWYRAYVPDRSEVATWSLRQSGGSAATIPANHNFVVSVTGRYADEGGQPHVTGTVRNENRTAQQAVTVNAALLNEAGQLVRVASGYALGGGTLQPGQTAPFDLWAEAGSEFSSAEVRAESSQAPSPLPVAVSSTGGGALGPGAQGVIDAIVTVRGTGVPLAHSVLRLYRRTAGTSAWVLAQLGQSDEQGRVRFAEAMQRTADYRVVSEASQTHLRAEAAVNHFAVGSRIGKVQPSGPRGQTFYSNLPVHLRAIAVPSERGRTVLLERKVGKKWIKVGSRRTNDQGQASFIQRLTKPGKYTYRAVLRSTALNGGAVGSASTIKVGGPWVD